MTWEPTDEEVRALRVEADLSHSDASDDELRVVLRAAWAVSPGPRWGDKYDTAAKEFAEELAKVTNYGAEKIAQLRARAEKAEARVAELEAERDWLRKVLEECIEEAVGGRAAHAEWNDVSALSETLEDIERIACAALTTKEKTDG